MTSSYRRAAISFLLLSCSSSLVSSWSLTSETDQEKKDEVPVEYGVDVSFPIHHEISTNYAWLPHNVDPSIPTPEEYKDMPVNPLGNRKAAYDEFIEGCVAKFGARGNRCRETERDRLEMSLRQPQSMQVRFIFPEDLFRRIMMETKTDFESFWIHRTTQKSASKRFERPKAFLSC